MSNLLYIYIAYYMQKGGEGVQIACKIAYVINGRPLSYDSTICIETVLPTKVHDESQTVCPKMHQRGNVKKDEKGIGKSFIESMHDGNMGHYNDPYYPH